MIKCPGKNGRKDCFFPQCARGRRKSGRWVTAKQVREEGKRICRDYE